jgi:hypothetical protein
MAETNARYHDPDGQCVWVSTGLLSHHLCDRDFDCDHCPLHLALSPLAGRKEADKAFWPKDRLYTAGHFWMKRISEHSARLGLSEMAVGLLHPVSKWRIESNGPASHGEVRIVAQLSCGWATLWPRGRFAVVRPNPCLEIDPLWPAADPWLSGYLLEFDFEDWATASEGWLELGLAAPSYAHHRELVHRSLSSGQALHSQLAVAADGGLPVAGLLPVVGRQVYIKLLLAILACNVVPVSGG